MSRANVEVALRAREAFNRRDFDALESYSHEDLEFVSALTAVDAEGAAYRGLKTWESYFEVMDQSWKDWQVEDFEVFDAGEDRVVSTFRLVGTGRHSGATVDQAAGITYRIRDGKLWRMRSYLDPQEALEAVGLRE